MLSRLRSRIPIAHIRVLVATTVLLLLVYGLSTFVPSGSRFVSKNVATSPRLLVVRRLLEVAEDLSITATGQAVKGSASVTCNGTFWHRFGKPWKEYSIESLSIAFLAEKAESRMLVMYAQGLEGVFRPGHERYVAVVVDPDQTVSVLWRTLGRAYTETIKLDGTFTTGQWHAISIVFRDGTLSVAAGSLAPGSSLKDMDESYKTLRVTKHDNAGGLDVDSGVYFGGVVDSRALVSYSTLKDTVPLVGRLSQRVHINGLALEVAMMPSGNTEDRAGPYLLDDIKFSLGGPVVKKPEPKNVYFDREPAALHFPVVSAVSDDHSVELEDMIGSVLTHMPERGVLVYDLGLQEGSRKRLGAFCNTTVRQFRRDLYGGQMWQLKFYMWKPVIVQSVVMEFGGAIYADSSIRFASDLATLPVLQGGMGFVGFEPKGAGPTGAFTHDGMLNYFGVRREDVAKARIATGGCQMWLDVPYVRTVLLRQWFRCALELQCMAPQGSSGWPCDQSKQYSGQFIGCHRYDQSALSVILHKSLESHKFSFAPDSYIVHDPDDLKYIAIERYVTNKYKRCRWNVPSYPDPSKCECTSPPTPAKGK